MPFGQEILSEPWAEGVVQNRDYYLLRVIQGKLSNEALNSIAAGTGRVVYSRCRTTRVSLVV